MNKKTKISPGIKWGELSKEQKEKLLKNANCIDAINGEKVQEGKFIVDLTNNLSIAGEVVDNGEEAVIVINNNAIIYNPAEGIL